MKYILNIWRLNNLTFIFRILLYYVKRLLKIPYKEKEKQLNGYYDFLIKNHGVLIKQKKEFCVSKHVIKGQSLLLTLRYGKHSDIFVYEQIFNKEEYRFSVEKYQTCFKNHANPIIIDAGSNIGLSVLYFKKWFPDSIIYAIEPFYENYRLLRINLQLNKIKDVHSISKALWYKNTSCKLVRDFRGGLDWSVRVEEENKGEICTITLQEIMFILKESFNRTIIDILKIDIEGSEKELFINESIQPYLKNVRLLVMEIHEEFIDKNTINQIMISYGFDVFEEGELSIFINKFL